MTSIAAYLANLTGAAPQEGQKATLANATGGIGLFAALLQSSGAPQEIDGTSTIINGTSELPIASPTGQVLNGNTIAGDTIDSDTVEGTALREALTEGLDLPQDGAEIEAAIIDVPIDAQQSSETPTQTVAQPSIQNETTQESHGSAQSASPEAVEEVVAPSALQEEDAPVETQKQPQTQAQGTTHTPPAGLENAVEKALQPGKENALQAALSQAPQARGAGQTGQESQTGQLVTAQGNKSSDASIDATAVATEDKSTDKPGSSRSEFSQKGAETIQRIIKPGNGQNIIQIQERTVADTPGASSPPTLTVSVQAPVASPGPASATPHAPVSALAVHIAQQANNGARRFDIRLDPPELGRIQVRLDVSRDGQVSTHLIVERVETLDLLQRDARQLERALQDAGLKTSEDNMKFTLKDQDLAQGGKDGLNNVDDTSPYANKGDDDDLSLFPDDAMPPPTRYLATSGLDIRI